MTTQNALSRVRIEGIMHGALPAKLTEVIVQAVYNTARMGEPALMQPRERS